MTESNEMKFKHLEFIQAAIGRMATNSFLYKGWALSVFAALAGVGVVQDQARLLLIAIVTTLLFWGLDGYYLWLERGFVKLHQDVAGRSEDEINFSMAIDKTDAFGRWVWTCLRPHLLFFYVAIAATEGAAVAAVSTST